MSHIISTIGPSALIYSTLLSSLRTFPVNISVDRYFHLPSIDSSSRSFSIRPRSCYPRVHVVTIRNSLPPSHPTAVLRGTEPTSSVYPRALIPLCNSIPPSLRFVARIALQIVLLQICTVWAIMQCGFTDRIHSSIRYSHHETTRSMHGAYQAFFARIRLKARTRARP